MLGIMAKERSKALPDVKTFDELGIKGIPEVGAWRGPIVPKDTPDEVVKILEDAFLKGAKEEFHAKVWVSSLSSHLSLDLRTHDGSKFQTSTGNVWRGLRSFLHKTLLQLVLSL